MCICEQVKVEKSVLSEMFGGGFKLAIWKNHQIKNCKVLCPMYMDNSYVHHNQKHDGEMHATCYGPKT